jgi:ABC-2 type transport system permease protein
VAELLFIYRRLTVARIRSDYQYRASFWLFTLGQFFITFFDFVAIAVIFGQVNELGGWSLSEVAFLYGITCVAFGLADMGISQVEDIADRIKLGTFDQLLIRPLSPLFQLAADDFALRRIGKVLQGAIVLVIAMSRLPVDWTPGRLLFVVITIISGAVIYGSVWVVTATISFFTVDSREVANAFTYGGNYMSQYPLPIYGVWLRRTLAFVIPLAFVSYFPAVGILGKHDPLGAPAAFHDAAPIVALLGIFVARAVWQFGIRHYRSTGS